MIGPILGSKDTEVYRKKRKKETLSHWETQIFKWGTIWFSKGCCPILTFKLWKHLPSNFHINFWTILHLKNSIFDISNTWISVDMFLNVLFFFLIFISFLYFSISVFHWISDVAEEHGKHNLKIWMLLSSSKENLLLLLSKLGAPAISVCIYPIRFETDLPPPREFSSGSLTPSV